MPISVPPAGYVVDPAAFVNIVFALVKLMFELDPATLMEAVSLDKAFAYTHPTKSLIVAPVISISPVDTFSMLYSSVIALPAPTIDQPFVVLSARSFTCGECPDPYPEPSEPI